MADRYVLEITTSRKGKRWPRKDVGIYPASGRGKTMNAICRAYWGYDKKWGVQTKRNSTWDSKTNRETRRQIGDELINGNNGVTHSKESWRTSCEIWIRSKEKQIIVGYLGL